MLTDRQRGKNPFRTYPEKGKTTTHSRHAAALVSRPLHNVISEQVVSGCAALYSENMQSGLLVDDGLIIVNPFAT